MMSSLKFCLWGGGTKIRWVRSPHKLDMSFVDRLNMECRHRAGFTYRLSRLKPRASQKMGGLIKTNEDLFFSSLSLEKRTSEVVYALFLLLTILIFSVKTGHLRT